MHGAAALSLCGCLWRASPSAQIHKSRVRRSQLRRRPRTKAANSRPLSTFASRPSSWKPPASLKKLRRYDLHRTTSQSLRKSRHGCSNSQEGQTKSLAIVGSSSCRLKRQQNLTRPPNWQVLGQNRGIEPLPVWRFIRMWRRPFSGSAQRARSRQLMRGRKSSRLTDDEPAR